MSGTMSGPRVVTPEKARELLQGATSGPWSWYGNTANRSIYLATVDRGRQFVLSFFRWGMRDATPALRADGHMENAATFARYEVAPDATDPADPRLYRHDFAGLRHPDAALIEAAPELAHTVVVQGEQIAAALALHTGMHPCPLGGGDSLVYDDDQTCPTARALGVTA